MDCKEEVLFDLSQSNWLSPIVLLEAHQKFITSLNYIVVKAVKPTEYTSVIQIKLFIGAFAV